MSTKTASKTIRNPAREATPLADPLASLDGAQALIKTLESLGVEYIFGYSGGAVIPIFDAIVTTGTKIRLITVRHEQAAVHMADGYARATGRPGIVLVTSGPGAGNAITGLMTARMDSVPIVLISGQQITSMLGLDAFQETDVINLSMPVVKHSYQILDANVIPQTVSEAYALSLEGRPGPVVIDIPKDVSAAPCLAEIPSRPDGTDIAIKKADGTLDTKIITGLTAIADAISVSQRPLLLVGQGVLISDAADELRRFVEENNIPVVTTLLGKGAIDETSPLSLGMLGMHGTAYANYAVMETDCLVSIGSRFDDRIVGDAATFADQAVICHIDIDPTEIGKMVRTDHSAVCDAGVALRELQNQVETATPRTAWLQRINELKNTYPLTYDRAIDSLSQQLVLAILDELTDSNAVIATDVGQHQMWAAQFCQTRQPRRWLSSGGAGTMGFGLPAALGAQFGCPDQLIISVSGDGGFQMTGYELATAALHKLPVKIIVLDNKYLGMVRQWQEIFYDNRESGVRLEGNPDFGLLAQAYGVKAIHIDNASDCRGKLLEALDYDDGPVVVWCEVEQTSNVYPMIPAGRSYDHMMLAAPTEKLQKPVGST